MKQVGVNRCAPTVFHWRGRGTDIDAVCNYELILKII